MNEPLVINKGSKNGVKNLCVLWFTMQRQKIIDPDTKKELGSLRIRN